MTDVKSEQIDRDTFSIFMRKDTKNETDVSNSEVKAKMKKMKKTDKQLQKSKKQQTQTTDQIISLLTERTQC